MRRIPSISLVALAIGVVAASLLLDGCGRRFNTFGENTLTACSDGTDNDGDGLVDCADSDCLTFCAGPTCGDGICDVVEDCVGCENDCGPCPAGCGDGTCDATEDCASCSPDCGACATCGDGTCDPGEDCTSCAGDCGSCPPGCPDGTCDATEDCSSCPADCGTCGPVCGDGLCDVGETCSSCVSDCGSCGPVCGDGLCESSETCSSCSSDCGTCGPVCGDGICEVTEDCTSCSADCGPCGGSCPGPFAGAGSNGGSGASCLANYTFDAIAGNSYTISTCANFTGDTYLVVSGACTCSNDDACGLGSECTCVATTTGPVDICASTYNTTSATWEYTITGMCL